VCYWNIDGFTNKSAGEKLKTINELNCDILCAAETWCTSERLTKISTFKHLTDKYECIIVEPTKIKEKGRHKGGLCVRKQNYIVISSHETKMYIITTVKDILKGHVASAVLCISLLITLQINIVSISSTLQMMNTHTLLWGTLTPVLQMPTLNKL